MTPLPTTAELCRRPEFRTMSSYLRSVRPGYPAFPVLPPLQFHTLASQQDHDPEFAGPPVYDPNPSPAPSGPANSAGAAPKQPLEAVHLEAMGCLWMLSRAVDQHGHALKTTHGLRCLNLPKSAAVDPEQLRVALRFYLQPDPPAEAANAVHLAEISILNFPNTSTETDQTKTAAAFREKIQKCLMLGSHVFLCRSDDAQDLPAEFSAFMLQSLTLPRVSRELIFALHCLAHPALPRLNAEDLPAQNEIETLSLQHCALAVSMAHQKPVLETIRTVLTQSRPPSRTAQTVLTLDGIVGNHSAVALGRQIVEDRAAWARGLLDWSEVRNGAFFYGPPGCGKTLVAQAISGSCNAELFMLSYADAINSAGGMDSRSILSRLSDIAHRAQKLGNSVVFIDEIDALGRSRFAQRDHNSTYYGTLTASVLRICDDLRASPGVTLIAATNLRDEIDPAILRPGRFDHHIALSPPDLRDIETLLSRDLPQIPAEAIAPVARNLVGCSFAEVAAVIKHSRAQARAARRDVAVADLTDAVAQQLPEALTDDADQDLWRAAVHESGHVLMLYTRMGKLPRQIRLQSNGEGRVNFSAPRIFNNGRLHDMIAMLLGGRAAELLVLGEISSGAGLGAGSDLQRATYLSICAEKSWHLSAQSDLVWQHVPAALTDHIPPDLRSKVSGFLRAQQKLALSTLTQHKPALLDLAQALLSQRELDQVQISEILAQHTELAAVKKDLPLPGPQPRSAPTDVGPGSEAEG